MTVCNKPNPRILALDVATVTGWCIGNVADAKPVGASQRIAPPGSSPGHSYLQFASWLTDLIKLDRPDIVFYEAPLDPRHVENTTLDTIRKLITMAGLVEMVAYGRAIYDVRCATVPDVRHHFIGRRNVKGDDAKKQTLRQCSTLGWEPRDHNHADAMALWSYAVSSIRLSKIKGLDDGKLPL